jgi:hypothetical protein
LEGLGFAAAARARERGVAAAASLVCTHRNWHRQNTRASCDWMKGMEGKPAWHQNGKQASQHCTFLACQAMQHSKASLAHPPRCRCPTCRAAHALEAATHGRRGVVP